MHEEGFFFFTSEKEPEQVTLLLQTVTLRFYNDLITIM